METKHTPGPWFYAGMRTVGGPDNKYVADCFSTDRPRWTCEANARLIAAAPELLAACKAFVTAFTKSMQLEKTDVAVRKARAAIAKAEGN